MTKKGYNMRVIIGFVLIMVNFVLHGQCWFEYKPNTHSDTVAIINNKVKSITRSTFFIGNNDTTLDSHYSVTIFQSNNKIDSSKSSGLNFFNKNIYKNSKDKIAETSIYIDFQDNKKTIYKRIYYLNNDGQIYLSTNKLLKGILYEGESYTKIEYIYKNDLLTEEIIYADIVGKNTFYCIQKYHYEFYTN